MLFVLPETLFFKPKKEKERQRKNPQLIFELFYRADPAVADAQTAVDQTAAAGLDVVNECK